MPECARQWGELPSPRGPGIRGACVWALAQINIWFYCPVLSGCVNFQLNEFTVFRNNFLNALPELERLLQNGWTIKTICQEEEEKIEQLLMNKELRKRLISWSDLFAGNLSLQHRIFVFVWRTSSKLQWVMVQRLKWWHHIFVFVWRTSLKMQ